MLADRRKTKTITLQQWLLCNVELQGVYNHDAEGIVVVELEIVNIGELGIYWTRQCFPTSTPALCYISV